MIDSNVQQQVLARWQLALWLHCQCLVLPNHGSQQLSMHSIIIFLLGLSIHKFHRWMTWVLNFITRFVVPDKDHLYSLSAGAPVSHEVERDVFHVQMIAKEVKEEFAREHFINGSSGRLFFEPIKQQRLKTMESANKAVRLTGQYLYSHLYFTALVLLMDSSTR